MPNPYDTPVLHRGKQLQTKVHQCGNTYYVLLRNYCYEVTLFVPGEYYTSRTIEPEERSEMRKKGCQS